MRATSAASAAGAGDLAAVLTSLAELCKDGERGFRAAAEEIEDPALRELCLSYANQRAQFCRELLQEIARLGVEPAAAGRAAGARRGVQATVAATAGRDERATLAELARRDRAAARAYEEAMSTAIPGPAGQTVERQSAAVSDSHDHLRALERTLAGRE